MTPPPQLFALVLGFISALCTVAGVFFLRYYLQSRDRLFLFFAFAFWLEGITRSLLAFSADPREGDPLIYGARFVAYLLILIGIWDKNRRSQ